MLKFSSHIKYAAYSLLANAPAHIKMQKIASVLFKNAERYTLPEYGPPLTGEDAEIDPYDTYAQIDRRDIVKGISPIKFRQYGLTENFNNNFLDEIDHFNLVVAEKYMENMAQERVDEDQEQEIFSKLKLGYHRHLCSLGVLPSVVRKLADDRKLLDKFGINFKLSPLLLSVAHQEKVPMAWKDDLFGIFRTKYMNYVSHPDNPNEKTIGLLALLNRDVLEGNGAAFIKSVFKVLLGNYKRGNSISVTYEDPKTVHMLTSSSKNEQLDMLLKVRNFIVTKYGTDNLDKPITVKKLLDEHLKDNPEIADEILNSITAINYNEREVKQLSYLIENIERAISIANKLPSLKTKHEKEIFKNLKNGDKYLRALNLFAREVTPFIAGRADKETDAEWYGVAGGAISLNYLFDSNTYHPRYSVKAKGTNKPPKPNETFAYVFKEELRARRIFTSAEINNVQKWLTSILKDAFTVTDLDHAMKDLSHLSEPINIEEVQLMQGEIGTSKDVKPSKTLRDTKFERKYKMYNPSVSENIEAKIGWERVYKAVVNEIKSYVYKNKASAKSKVDIDALNALYREALLIMFDVLVFKDEAQIGNPNSLGKDSEFIEAVEAAMKRHNITTDEEKEEFLANTPLVFSSLNVKMNYKTMQRYLIYRLKNSQGLLKGIDPDVLIGSSKGTLGVGAGFLVKDLFSQDYNSMFTALKNIVHKVMTAQKFELFSRYNVPIHAYSIITILSAYPNNKPIYDMIVDAVDEFKGISTKTKQTGVNEFAEAMAASRASDMNKHLSMLKYVFDVDLEKAKKIDRIMLANEAKKPPKVDSKELEKAKKVPVKYLKKEPEKETLEVSLEDLF